MTDKMLSRKEGGVGYVIFNNPERHNAVSLEMWAATRAILDDFRADDSIRVVVLTGAGGKAFVSGADISKFGAERASQDGIAKYNATTELAFSGVNDFPKPTIAMIRGYCIGGGMALATCCDMRIATPGSKFGIPAAKLGLGYDAKGIRRLMSVVGPVLCQGNLLHRAAIRCRRSAHDGLRQPRSAGRRARNLCEELRRDDRRQCAAHHRRCEIRDCRNC